MCPPLSGRMERIEQDLKQALSLVDKVRRKRVLLGIFILFYCILFYLILSYLILSYLILSYLILFYFYFFSFFFLK